MSTDPLTGKGPAFARIPPGEVSPLLTLFNITKSFVGSGLLSLPYSFSKGGLAASCAGCVLVSYLSFHSMSKLVRVRRQLLLGNGSGDGSSRYYHSSSSYSSSSGGVSSVDTVPAAVSMSEEAPLTTAPPAGGDACELENAGVQLATYGDLGAYCFGMPGRVAVNGLLLATQLGFCTGYVLFVAETLAGLIGRFSTRFWIAVLILPYTLLAFIRSYKSLAPVSVAGLGALAIATGVCLTYSGREITKHGTNDTVVMVNWSELPVFVGMIISSFEGIGLALPVEQSMRNPRLYPRLLAMVMISLVFLYTGVGMLGYYAFGKGSKSILSLNLPQRSVLVDVVEVLMCLAIMFTFPIMMAPVSEVAEKSDLFARWAFGPYQAVGDSGIGNNPDTAAIAVNNGGHLEQQRRRHAGGGGGGGGAAVEAKRNLVRFGLVLFTSALAAAVPAFGLVRGLVGAFGGTALMFVLPAAIRLKAVRGSATERAVDWTLLVFGAAACVFCTTITIIQIAKNPEEKT